MHHSAARTAPATALASLIALGLALTLTGCGGSAEPPAQIVRAGGGPTAGASASPAPDALPAGQVPQVGKVPDTPVALREGTGMILPGQVDVGEGVIAPGRLADGITVAQVEALRSTWNGRKALQRSLEGSGCTADPAGVWAAVRPMKRGDEALLLGTWEGRDTVQCTVGNARIVVDLDNNEVVGDSTFASLLVR